MKKIIFSFVCALAIVMLYPRVFSFVYRWVPAKWWTERIAYGQVRDIYYPTSDDYRSLQKFLTEGKRPKLEHLGDMQKRMSHFCIIGKSEKEEPRFGTVAVNCEEEDKEACILVYSSFNKGFPRGVERLIDLVSKSDFKGHILYRIGGWPNVEEGDLTLAHVPYAFKPCFFREAQRLGYKKVLWLDTSIIPIHLTRVFTEIGEKGYFVVGNGQLVGPFMNELAASRLGVSLEECGKIPSCAACIFGVDFSNEKACRVISDWRQAARDSDAFFSMRSDQNALSIILHQQGLHEWAPLDTLVELIQPISANTCFKIDRGFVHFDN